MIIKLNWQKKTRSIESLNRLSILFAIYLLITKFFRKDILSLIKWKFEYVRIDIFYSIIYNRIVKKSQTQLSTNLSSTNSVIHKSFQLSTILRQFFDVRLEIQLPFNSTFSSSHYCFFIPMEGKKNWWKNTRKNIK